MGTAYNIVVQQPARVLCEQPWQVRIGIDARMTSLKTEVISDVSEFDSLREEWTDLFLRNGLHLFDSFEWRRTWWKYFGETNPKASLHIILVRDNKKLVGIAPLFLEKVRVVGIFSVKKLSFIAQVTSDYLDVVVEKGMEDICFAAFAGTIASARPRCDVVHLADITERSATSSMFEKALEEQSFHGQRFVNDFCPRTRLHGSWDKTLEAFAGNHRKEVRRRIRNLSNNFVVNFSVADNATTVGEEMDQLVDLHQSQWNDAGQVGIFIDPRIAKFHKEVARLFYARGWLYLASLRIDGRLAAINYGFIFRNEMAIYISGCITDDDARKFSIGRVLTGHCMAEASNSGLQTYDFMRGTEPYKYEFEGVDVPNWSLVMFRNGSLTARAKYSTHLLMLAIKRWIVREWTMLKLHKRKQGLFSKQMVDHLIGTVRRNLSRLGEKVR